MRPPPCRTCLVICLGCYNISNSPLLRYLSPLSENTTTIFLFSIFSDTFRDAAKVISFSLFFCIRKPGDLTVSSRANGKMDTTLLMSHSIEAHERIVQRSSHMICPGVWHSTTHDVILFASHDTVHHLRLLRLDYFYYSAEQLICKLIPFYRR